MTPNLLVWLPVIIFAVNEPEILLWWSSVLRYSVITEGCVLVLSKFRCADLSVVVVYVVEAYLKT